MGILFIAGIISLLTAIWLSIWGWSIDNPKFESTPRHWNGK